MLTNEHLIFQLGNDCIGRELRISNLRLNGQNQLEIHSG